MNILPFLVGEDFPPDDPHYACFMLLNDIATILFSPIIAHEQVPFLKLLIQQYLEQFRHLYPHRPLPPKFHYLLHLATLITRFDEADSVLSIIMLFICYRYGPLVHLWSMRFEGKHKIFKAAARGTSYKNILKTLTQHHQRLMAYNLHYDGSFASVETSTGAGDSYPMLSSGIIILFLILIAAYAITSPLSLPYIDVIKIHHPKLLQQKLYRLE